MHVCHASFFRHHPELSDYVNKYSLFFFVFVNYSRKLVTVTIIIKCVHSASKEKRMGTRLPLQKQNVFATIDVVLARDKPCQNKVSFICIP